MKIIIIVFLAFLVSGCLYTKRENAFAVRMSEENKLVLNEMCEAIKNEGDLISDLELVKKETREILKLLENLTPEVREEIHRKTEIIKIAGERVYSLSRQEWNEEKWDYEIIWKIRKDDFKEALGSRLPFGFGIRKAEVLDVYFLGEKRPDLKKLFVVTRKPNEVDVLYMRRGSALEFCQLQRTLVVLSKVQIKNLNFFQDYHFSLYKK